MFELAAYGTNIVTLRLGDHDWHRHTDGRGSARTPSIYLKDGNRSVCTYADLGTLTNLVVGASSAPVATQ